MAKNQKTNFLLKLDIIGKGLIKPNSGKNCGICHLWGYEYPEQSSHSPSTACWFSKGAHYSKNHISCYSLKANTGNKNLFILILIWIRDKIPVLLLFGDYEFLCKVMGISGASGKEINLTDWNALWMLKYSLQHLTFYIQHSSKEVIHASGVVS